MNGRSNERETEKGDTRPSFRKDLTETSGPSYPGVGPVAIKYAWPATSGPKEAENCKSGEGRGATFREK